MTVLRDLFRALQEVYEPGTILNPGYRWRRTKWSPIDPEEFIVPENEMECA